MIGVTGANGLLGSFIVRKLIDEGSKFVAFKRKDSDVSLLDDVSGKVTWREIDLLDPVTMDDAVAGLTSIIHSAALVSFDPRLAREIAKINTDGTRNIVNACLANGIDRLVYISSVAALGRTKGQTMVDENNKWVESAQHTAYATSKYLAELEVYRGQEEGLTTVILNPSVILAPADWQKSSAKLFKYVWDERLFYIDGSMNYVDVRDVAAAATMALKSGMENERYIVNGGTVSFKEFFDGVATRFGKKPPMIKLNRIILEIVAELEMLRAGLRRSEPLVTPETARLAGTFFQYQNSKIKNAFHLEFQPLGCTLDWCCRYYLGKYGLKKE